MFTGDKDEGHELTSEECVRAGMYWFGRSDFTAANAWWERALEIDPQNTRAQECLRLLRKASPTGIEEDTDDQQLERLGVEAFGPESSSENMAVLIGGEDGEPSVPMDAQWDRPEMVLDPSGDLRTSSSSYPADSGPSPSSPSLFPGPPPPSSPSAPAPSARPSSSPVAYPAQPQGSSGQSFGAPGPRDRPPDSNVPHGTEFPFYDDPEPPAAAAADDVFDFAAQAQQGRSPSKPLLPPSYASPWDDGPSRTSVLTLDDNNDDDYDAVPDPTPLPAVDRERFFGRAPETPSEILDFLRATGDLQSLSNGQSAAPHAGPGPAQNLPPGGARSPDLLTKAGMPAADEDNEAPGVLIDDPVDYPDDEARTEYAVLPTAESSTSTPEQILAEARRRYQLHDFDGASELLESMPPDAAESPEVRNLIASSRQQMLRMYESKIGDFNQIPEVLISNEEVIWLNLNHRAGFILSQIDGAVTYEDIVSLSGMPRLDTVRIITQLLNDRVIGVKPPS